MASFVTRNPVETKVNEIFSFQWQICLVMIESLQIK